MTPKRGWYVLRNLMGGIVELFSGPHLSQRKAYFSYCEMLHRTPFGEFPLGTKQKLVTAADFKRKGDNIVDRRKEFADE